MEPFGEIEENGERDVAGRWKERVEAEGQYDDSTGYQRSGEV